jgi:glycerophosphoryl diester phosphodiesterase
VPRTLVLGHRGSPASLPENTLASFQRALEEGADGVELDVQLSAEGVPVVIHDPDLDRTTDGTGPVGAHAAAELASLRAGGEPIPTLAEALAWRRERGVVMNVEIKHRRGAAPVLEALRRDGGAEGTFLSSFHLRVLEELRAANAELPLYLLSKRCHAGAIAAAHRLSARGVCLRDDAATPGALARLRDEGLRVVVWTVDAPARIAALLADGVEGLITNHPALASGLRDAG